MSLVARSAGQSFWIDQTEVTVGQFAEFVAAGAPLRGSVCEGDPGTGPFQCQVPADPDMPRTCVDWCEADGFCAWAGKELCRDDVDRGAIAPRDVSDFYAACAPTANAFYGCGEGCDPSACNGVDAANGKILPVRTSPACCVADACGVACAIADLSGNVGEWTAACKPLTPDGNCLVRGGNFQSNAAELLCDAITNVLPRRRKYATVGFRCCAHP
jgi:formylglycine-generating enzyme required for sulfatase activity